MESKNKKKDPVQQFLELRKNLKQERMELVEQIKRIDDALASTMSEAKKQPNIESLKQPRTKRNKISLKNAVIKITTQKPRTKIEIMSALNDIGYVFSSATPINSLNATLYSKGQFINKKGYFSPAKR